MLEDLQARVVVVVAAVAHHNQRGAAVYRVEIVMGEALKCIAHIRAVVARRHTHKHLLNGFVGLAPCKVRGNVLQVIDEGESVCLGDHILECVHKRQHKLRAVAHGGADVADDDQLGLEAVVAMLDLEGHAAVAQA